MVFQTALHTEQMLGLYASVYDAKASLRNLAHNEGLCEKVLGFEKRQGACFAYQLKRCRGACVGAESPAVFNQRLMDAFAPQTLAAWPFEGAVVITEPATKYGKAAHHLVDRWNYLGSVEELEGLGFARFLGDQQGQNKTKDGKTKPCLKPVSAATKISGSLDKDAYRILLGFLLNPDKYQLQIRSLADL